MLTPVERWGAAGDELLGTLDDHGLRCLAVIVSRLYLSAIVQMRRVETPALLDAGAAARMLGPSITAKWVYNHVKDMPPGCVKRIGRRVMFVGPKLREWACDTAQTVTRGRPAA